MSILSDFDEAIVSISDIEGGYKIGDSVYYNYLSNAAWQKLLDAMDSNHRERYDVAGGKELEEKGGKPPKMASFASSSRMIYELSKDIPGFCFEKKLATKIGGVANLDGYLENEDSYIFVEAKCREPYSHKATQKIKQNYKPIYEYLSEKMPNVFSAEVEDIAGTRDMKVTFYCKGEVVTHFDIKQMICHMLGIANKMLDEDLKGKNILFLYLLYNPCHLQIAESSREEVLHIYEETCLTADEYCFEEMFGHIVDFMAQIKSVFVKEEEIIKLKKSFQFVLCDQKNYGEYFVNA